MIKRKLPLNNNKIIVKKNSKKNSPLSRVNLPIWLQSLANRLKRNFHGSDKSQLNVFKIMESLLAKRKRVVLLISTIFFLALILSLIIFINTKYNQIAFQSFSGNQESSVNIYANKNQNILFVNFKRSIDGSNQFAEFITLISYNKITNNLNTLAIEPKLLAYYKGKAYTLETLINNINENAETKSTKFIAIIEDIMGIRIDAYLFSDNQLYGEFIKAKNFSLQLNESFKTSNKFYKSGDSIFGDDLLIYLNINDSEEELKSYLLRNNIFVTNILQNNRNIFFSLGSFIDSSIFTSTFKTNLSKDNAMRFYSDIFYNSNLPITREYISLRDGYMINTAFGEALVVNQIDIERKVQNLFRDLDVVKEQARIEVLNGSSVSGLASVVKKIIQNSGGNVVNSGNYPVSEAETTLYIIDSNIANYSNTVAFIKSLYPNLKIADNVYKYNKLGNLILVLGNNQ